jgi:hypothetical protein
MALTFVASGLVEDDSVTDILENTVNPLAKANSPKELLAPVTQHWHEVEKIAPLDPDGVRSAEVVADRIVEQMQVQIAEK